MRKKLPVSPWPAIARKPVSVDNQVSVRTSDAGVIGSDGEMPLTTLLCHRSISSKTIVKDKTAGIETPYGA